MVREMKLYRGSVRGVKVSEYGLQNGYLDYFTLSKMVGDHILNNTVFRAEIGTWELLNGDDYYGVDPDGDYCDPDAEECVYTEFVDIYQFYIIDENGYQFLAHNTDELVYYNEELDMYLWGITHFGTSWDYVLTDIRLVD